MDVSGFDLEKVAGIQEHGQKDPQELRLFLNDVRTAAYGIRGHIERNLREPEQAPVKVTQRIQPGSFKAILTRSDGQKIDISDTTYLAFVEERMEDTELM